MNACDEILLEEQSTRSSAYISISIQHIQEKPKNDQY